ncbi:phage antirepressor KilAC domain-containing protein [Caballeronia sp. RCC_10]|uniref:phage antirepressor KilAC domain-containing protein n=1 Tax=Caballeronia sp. RCC_10 TaxID=3239227 RepID=UPI003523B878
MTTRLEARAKYWAKLVERAGGKALPEERVRVILEKAEQRRAAAREDAVLTSKAAFAGCQSITAAAKALGVSRTALFEWLECHRWIERGRNGNWLPTFWAVSQGFAVSRGPAPIQYAQITAAGRTKLARHLDRPTGNVSTD